MKPNLDPIKEQLLLFRDELTERVLWEKETPIAVYEEYPIEPWRKTEAYSWMFFEINYRFFLGSIRAN